MSNPDKPATFLSLVSLGIGSIVGAGIFALMGEAAALSGSALWVAFVVAGCIALLTGHSYVQLGIRYPSRGGVVEYIRKAYGTGLFSGGCSVISYISQVIGMAMIALAFGKFAAMLFGIEDNQLVWERILGSGLIVGLSALALIGTGAIARLQRIVVVVNLLLLAGFTVALAGYMEPASLSFDTWPTGTPVLGSLALTFFAYSGFSVIGNAADKMRDPARDLPRAMYTSIGIALILYVGLALTITAVVSEQELVSSGAMLLPVAARSIFGDIGFTILVICAVLSTVTCLNGGLYGVTNISFTLAQHGQLPPRFEQKIGASTRGLTISALLALIMVNFMSLTTVAVVGSATKLLIDLLVNFGALRLVGGRGLQRALTALSVLACLGAILVWILYTLKYAPQTFIIFAVFVAISFLAEIVIRRYTRND
jgi:amino acid transporter